MSRRVFWGSALLLVGALLLASNLGYLAAFSVWSLWPILVMWPTLRAATRHTWVTVSKEPRRKRIWVGGNLWFRLVMLWVFAGATAQLVYNLGLWPYDWGYVAYWTLPVLLVGMGLTVLLRPRHRAFAWVRREHVASGDCCGDVSSFAVDLRFGNRPWVFKSPMKVDIWAGDIDLDLSTAQFSPGANYLYVSAFAADVDIRAPEGIEVEAEASCSAGDIGLFHEHRSGLGVHLCAGRRAFGAAERTDAGSGRSDPEAANNAPGSETKEPPRLYIKVDVTFGDVKVR
jgi:hypothetical protein